MEKTSNNTLLTPMHMPIFEVRKTISNSSETKEFLISTDKKLLDLDVIHDFLSNQSYWCKGIQKWVLERSIRNCLSFGVYDLSAKNKPQQVGFTRVVTDYATFAYVVDVFILPSHRQFGLSKWLIPTVLKHPELQYLRRWLLTTHDATELYEKYGGFKLVTNTNVLSVHKPDIYATLPQQDPQSKL